MSHVIERVFRRPSSRRPAAGSARPRPSADLVARHDGLVGDRLQPARLDQVAQAIAREDQDVDLAGRFDRDRLLADRDLSAARGDPLAALRDDARQQARLIEGADLQCDPPVRGDLSLRGPWALASSRSSPPRDRPADRTGTSATSASRTPANRGSRRRGSTPRATSDSRARSSWYENRGPTVKSTRRTVAVRRTGGRSRPTAPKSRAGPGIPV